MKKNNYSVKHSSKAYLAALFLPQVLSVAVILIFSVFYKDLTEMQNAIPFIIIMMLVAQIGFGLVYVYLNKKNNVDYKIASQLNFKLNIKNVVLCIVISIVAIAGFVNFVGIFDELIQKLGYESSSMLLANSNFGYFILNVLICALAPAIMEELLFRGIIFNGLKSKGFWFASIVSSIMFMTVHLSLASVVYPILMGIIFCMVVQKTGSIIYSMIIHFCNNFIVILIQYVNQLTGKNFGSIIATEWWHYILIIVAAIFAFAIIYFIIKLLNKDQKYIEVQEDAFLAENNQDLDANTQIFDNQLYKKNNTSYLATSCILGLAFWLFMVILSIL